MVEEINLNTVENLNPTFQKLPVMPVTPVQIAEEVTGVKRPKPVEQQVEEWNNKPEVKSAGIKADKISTWNFWKTLGIIGIVCLIIFAGVSGLVGWTIYQDGTLIPSFVCANNFTSSCPSDINTNTCGACVCNLNFTCPVTQVNLNCSK